MNLSAIKQSQEILFTHARHFCNPEMAGTTEAEYQQICKVRPLFHSRPTYDCLLKLYQIACMEDSTMSDLRLEILSMATCGQFTGHPAQKQENQRRAQILINLLTSMQANRPPVEARIQRAWVLRHLCLMHE